MDPQERRDPRPLYRLVLAALVLLSWGYVLYGAREAARRQLQSELAVPRLP